MRHAVIYYARPFFIIARFSFTLIITLPLRRHTLELPPLVAADAAFILPLRLTGIIAAAIRRRPA